MNWNKAPHMTRSFAIASYYYPDEVGIG